MDSTKSVHTVVLDTGSIIKNEPSVSTLLNQAESLVTAPSIISEIKDAATRSRVETTLQPFLTLRSPSPLSVKFVTDFARRTGDLPVLSKADIQIIALTYEIECERNGGDWRLRRTPGQKTVNGAPPAKQQSGTESSQQPEEQPLDSIADMDAGGESSEEDPSYVDQQASEDTNVEKKIVPDARDPQSDPVEQISHDISDSNLNDVDGEQPADPSLKVDSVQNSAESQDDSDSDGGWITPSNLKKKQAKDIASSSAPAQEPKTMQVAVLTTDFAMQNVILQINLNLLSPSMSRVKHIKTFVLRCHGCFQVTKDLTKQFCPKCGQPSLTRVSCSTNSNGEFKLHLKKNFQWNTRGDRYSIPKAVHGSANGRVKGGGKGGWGNDLILAEDQKEYQKAVKEEKRQKERNLMDEDYLPGILSGDRGRAGGRIKVGAGKNVNSRKR